MKFHYIALIIMHIINHLHAMDNTYPLQAALAKKNNEPEIIALLKNTDINSYFDNHTPLTYALNHNVEYIPLLLEHGANPNQPDKEGYYPLQMAFHIRKMKMVTIESLLKAGADASATYKKPGSKIAQHETPYSIATKYNDQSLIELLEQYGAKSPTLIYNEEEEEAQNYWKKLRLDTNKIWSKFFPWSPFYPNSKVPDLLSIYVEIEGGKMVTEEEVTKHILALTLAKENMQGSTTSESNHLDALESVLADFYHALKAKIARGRTYEDEDQLDNGWKFIIKPKSPKDISFIRSNERYPFPTIIYAQKINGSCDQSK